MYIINHILVFVLIMGLNNAHAIIVEAESASIKTAGKLYRNGWALYSNGTIGEHIQISKSGKYEVTIFAKGSPLAGRWPFLAINIDGIAKEIITVDKNYYSPITFIVHLPQGVRFVGATFFNDAYKPGREDRNLYIDKFVIRNAGTSENLIVYDKDLTIRETKKIENFALAKTDDGIIKNRMGSGTIVVLSQNGHPLPGVSVTVNQIQHDFLFGCNIFMFDKFPTERQNALYKKRFQELFNYATVPLYWRSFEPKPGRPNYSYLDKVVTWCRQRDIKLKGHPLLWDHDLGIPQWSNGQPPVKAMRKRVMEILHRYKYIIDSWDIVNEPAHLSNIAIDAPYRWARETSSDAYLIVNDYGIFSLGGYPPFFNLLKSSIRKGVPFDGIGIQAHSTKDIAFPLDQVQAILDLYAILGKELHITEFTPTSNGKAVLGSSWRDRWDEKQQADYAEKFYRICFAHKAVAAITWWDLTDNRTFRRFGGMLRKDLSPKPVYKILKHLINTEWHSHFQGKTNNMGKLKFSGYYGTYRITCKKDGIIKEIQFHIGKGKENTLKITF